ncbi:MAG: hypothetical protein ACLPKB_03800 [Xanthobacteraceae bacterium]
MRSIKTNAHGRVAGVTAYWVSQRNEENTVFSRFRARLERRINDWKVDQSLRDAYSIILGVVPFDKLSDARASSTLGTLATASLIDAYTGTLLALETILMGQQWLDAPQMLQAIVLRLPQTDPRIRNMKALLSSDFSTIEKASTDIVDRLCQGQAVVASLAGHIRGPLEEQGLLAVRDHGTNQYRMLRAPQVDDQSIDENDWESVRRCVEIFSRNFDSIIDTLLKERLQIKRDEKPKGLFVFEPVPLMIYYLRANIDEGSTFQQFLSKVLDALDIYLAISLQNVRKYITEGFSDVVAAFVDQFRSSIDEKVNPTLNAELQQLIGRASPELQASIERVASWFAPDAEKERRALRTMEQIVDIAIQATNNAHRGFDPVFHLDIDDLGLQTNETLLEITDMLFTILDNIYTHSGLNDPAISIRIMNAGEEDRGGTRVRTIVTNQIAPGTKTLANEHRLERIRRQIESGDYRALSKVEGGTGFLKLKRMVAADNRQTLAFGYDPHTLEFFVEVTTILVFTLVQAPPESLTEAS